MKMIWKFPLSLTNEQKMSIPSDWTLLSVKMQRQNSGEELICIWAEVDPDSEITEIRVLIRGTGCQFIGDEGHFLGTVLNQANNLVWHVYLHKDE